MEAIGSKRAFTKYKKPEGLDRKRKEAPPQSEVTIIKKAKIICLEGAQKKDDIEKIRRARQHLPWGSNDSYWTNMSPETYRDWIENVGRLEVCLPSVQPIPWGVSRVVQFMSEDRERKMMVYFDEKGDPKPHGRIIYYNEDDTYKGHYEGAINHVTGKPQGDGTFYPEEIKPSDKKKQLVPNGQELKKPRGVKKRGNDPPITKTTEEILAEWTEERRVPRLVNFFTDSMPGYRKVYLR